MKKRFAEEQIVRFLQEEESGISARDLGRKHKISAQTVYWWKNKYDGTDVSGVKRLQEYNMVRPHGSLAGRSHPPDSPKNGRTPAQNQPSKGGDPEPNYWTKDPGLITDCESFVVIPEGRSIWASVCPT